MPTPKTRTEAKPTPTPWKVALSFPQDAIQIQSEKINAYGNFILAEVPQRTDEDKANADYIVKCVNAHAELMTIVRKLQECFETGVDKAVIYAAGFSDLNPNNEDETWQEAVERIANAERGNHAK